jgi:hypothetical protein
VSTYRVTVGTDTMLVELGQPEHPILVDGEESGHQCAKGSCRTDDCIRIAVRAAYGMPIYETEKEAIADGRSVDGSEEIIIWDEVSYEAES